MLRLLSLLLLRTIWALSLVLLLLPRLHNWPGSSDVVDVVAEVVVDDAARLRGRVTGSDGLQS